MTYKKCPQCETNYISKDEAVCKVCRPENNKLIDISNYPGNLSCGKFYGSNARTIYEGFCDSFGWDKQQSYKFYRGGIFNAKNASADRKHDVWFIFASNFSGDSAENWSCKISEDTNIITQTYKKADDSYFGSDRIVFAKIKNKDYQFLGVYTITERKDNSTTYKKIHSNYPF